MQKEKISDEDFKNVVGLFALLLKVDKRINPELYKTKSSIHEKRSSVV